LEKLVYDNLDPFAEYNLIPGLLQDGYEIIINMRDDYLILNDENNNKDSIQEMKNLFKRYGINERYINWWKNNSYSRQNLNYEILEEKEKNKIKLEHQENLNNENKIKMVELNKQNFKFMKDNLKKQEIIIRNNFRLINKNFSNFRKSFSHLKEIIMSVSKLSFKIKDIYPYGSISQLSQNINSDYEISIITDNYSSLKNSDIKMAFEKISSYIEINNKKEYKIKCIRTTKRTFLLIIKDLNYNINIEINFNNIFSLLNSNLIYKYVTYDARALILVNTIKEWSKIKGINSNHEGFMSSYCYTLLTIFFLQRIKNPLVPIIHSNINRKTITIREKEYFIEKNLLSPEIDFKEFKSKNKEDTITTLLLKFFVFYLYLFNENDYCIDISNDKLTFRYNEVKYLNYFEERNKISVYCFIDMFDYTYNPGSYMDRNSTPHKLYIKKLKKSLIQLLNGEDNLLKPDFEIDY
jgi:DNA polymerase sigma